jgi:hypothetical protein
MNKCAQFRDGWFGFIPAPLIMVWIWDRGWGSNIGVPNDSETRTKNRPPNPLDCTGRAGALAHD